MSFVVKDYECICPECGRICENGFCYECGIRLDVKEKDEVIEDPIYYNDDYGYEDIENVDDLWEDEVTDGDLDYYYNRYSK